MKSTQSIPGAFMWPILVAVPVVTLMVLAVTSSLRHRADESRAAQFLLERLDQQASFLDALISQAEAENDGSTDLAVRGEATRRDVAATLRELQSFHRGAIYEQIGPACTAYLAAVQFRDGPAGAAARALPDAARRY